MQLLAEEYRTLSTTGNLTDRHTYIALQWGTAIVAVIVSAVLTQWGKHDALIEAALLVGIPILVSFGMLYWIGELARMTRVYDFICIVEEKAELALRVGTTPANRGWYAQFESRWQQERSEKVETKLGIALPERDGEVVVDVAAAPMQFERWLREIRNKRASKNLSWVFMFRLAVFPTAIAGSWGAGMYYLLAHKGAQATFGFVAAAVGGLLSVAMTWLAAELATDLNDSDAKQTLWTWRATCRSLVHKVLALPEWG